MHWYEIKSFNQNFFENVNICENRLKLINRWYLNAEKIGKDVSSGGG